MAKFLSHSSCLRCGSRDANALYDDGSSYCFSCQVYETTDNMEQETIKSETTNFVTGSSQDIPNRKLNVDTCSFYGYQVGTFRGEPCHIANYRDPKTQKIITQKIRQSNKKFSIVGTGKSMPFFGQHLWGSGGKSVVITEGEIDCLSVAQAFQCKWPVVSLPNGAQSAAKVIREHLAWLSSFEKVVLCFDMDEPGIKAAEDAAQELPIGHSYIMRMPNGFKDANEVLVAEGTAPIVKAYWNAQQYRPDGIVSFVDLREALLNPVSKPSIPYPWSCLNSKLRGIRTGELVTVTAGSGLGKSTFVKEILYHLAVNHNQPVGLIFLEEQGQRTAEILVSMYLGTNLLTERSSVSKEDIERGFDYLATKNISLYSHFGSNDVDNICNKIRFMVKSEGTKYVFLDHLSILVSDSEVDERKLIDATMTKLRTLVSELDFSLFIISHLKRPSGDKGHEDGVPVTLGQLRGSHAIAQLSDMVIGLQKDPEEPTADTMIAVILKNRLTGERGVCGTLQYNRETMRLTEGIF